MIDGMSKSGLPNNIQVELVQGCNRLCTFCGLQALWAKPETRHILFADKSMLAELAVSLTEWQGFEKKRIEFAMHGEPTLHRHTLDIVSVFRKQLPYAQLQLTTNGITIAKKGAPFISQLFHAGVNILVVDIYQNKKEILDAVSTAQFPTHSYYADPNCPNPYHYHNHNLHAVVIMDDLGIATGKRTARKILNHAGNVPTEALLQFGIAPIAAPLRKKCSRPFREISVHFDGTVSVCCMDWRHERVLGVFPNESISDIWNGSGFTAARALLGRGKRCFAPCDKCDYNGGFRLGLLPAAPPEDCAAETLAKLTAKNRRYVQ